MAAGCLATDPLPFVPNHPIKDPFWSLLSLFKCKAKLNYTHCINTFTSAHEQCTNQILTMCKADTNNVKCRC